MFSVFKDSNKVNENNGLVLSTSEHVEAKPLENEKNKKNINPNLHKNIFNFYHVIKRTVCYLRLFEKILILYNKFTFHNTILKNLKDSAALNQTECRKFL